MTDGGADIPHTDACRLRIAELLKGFRQMDDDADKPRFQHIKKTEALHTS